MNNHNLCGVRIHEGIVYRGHGGKERHVDLTRNVFTNVISRIIHSAEFRMTSSSLSQVVTVYGTLKFFFLEGTYYFFSFYTIFNFKFLSHSLSSPRSRDLVFSFSFSPLLSFPPSFSSPFSLASHNFSRFGSRFFCCY